MPYASVSLTSLGFLSAVSHPAASLPPRASNRPTSRTASKGTDARVARRILAFGLSAAIAASVSAASLADTRSHLFTMTTSANSIWRTSKSPTVLVLLSSATETSPPSRSRPNRSTSSEGVARSPANAAAETTVTIASKRATWPSEVAPFSARSMSRIALRSAAEEGLADSGVMSATNVSAICSGSETPDASMTMASNVPLVASSAIATTRSDRSVQHTHPFCISIVVPPPVELTRAFRTRFASTFSAATSFTTVAILCPDEFSRMCLSSVVFPAPRKPERRVTGQGARVALDISGARGRRRERRGRRGTWLPLAETRGV